MPESGARCSGYKDEFSGVLVSEEFLLQSGQFPCSLWGLPSTSSSLRTRKSGCMYRMDRPGLGIGKRELKGQSWEDLSLAIL